MTDTTDIAGSSDLNKQQIIDVVAASPEWLAHTADIPKVVYFTQAGAGAQDGTTAANARPISQFNSYVPTPGDCLVLSGAITSGITLSSIHNGTIARPVSVIGVGGASAAYMNPGSSVIAVTIAQGVSHVHISDIRVGTCNYGIYGFALWQGLIDIHIDRFVVENAAATGIGFITGVVDRNIPYAVCHDVVITDCEVFTAGYHGIQLGIYSDGSCGVRRSVVHQAATAGNFWGIYASSFLKAAKPGIWTGTNPYTITTTALGWGGNAQYQIIEQLMIQDYTTVNNSYKNHFTKGTWGALNDFEFAQNGTGGDVQIKLPAADALLNTRTVYSSPFVPSVMGGFFEHCRAHNVSNNSGTTDGHGIGTDFLCSNWNIDYCESHDNEGVNFVLDASGGCSLRSCKSWRAGTYGLLVHNGGRATNGVYDCRSFGDPHGLRIMRTEADNVECAGLFVVDSADWDISLENTTSIVAANLGNTSKNCARNWAAYITAL